MTDQERRKCTRCKMNLTLEHFNVKRDDSYMKRCKECNKKCCKYNKKNRETDIAKHNKEVDKMIRDIQKMRECDQYLGCTYEFYFNYINDLLEDGMDWDNYEKFWKIDYIVPFNYQNSVEEEIEKFNYKNTKPVLI